MMDQNFIHKIFHAHQEYTKIPATSSIIGFFNDLLGVLFPDFSSHPAKSEEQVGQILEQLQTKLKSILTNNISLSGDNKQEIIEAFFTSLPVLYDRLALDIEAMFQGDPAASDHSEIIRSYPGFYAIASYRLAHELALLGVKNIPRIITEHAHSKTGIDIHPNAIIGEHFCIDHGTGIVIGETTVIGKHVKIYQGVTLGALSVDKKDAKVKRHPTIEDHVVIYAGATILGGKTRIGKHSIIGGNVWLTKSIPANSRVYYQALMHEDNESKPDLIIVKQA
ncbi:serine O-acetyltransferase [Marinoscillum sp.]|uniref:serine O-acetyltransferase n=1 Tax=Marinoscillum sp. TaxID=2024838 RepID=UPI003BA9DED6